MESVISAGKKEWGKGTLFHAAKYQRDVEKRVLYGLTNQAVST